MSISVRHIRLGLGCMTLPLASPAFAQVSLTPLPETLEMGRGQFTVRDGAGIALPANDAAAAAAARILIAHVKTERGLTLTTGTAKPAIRFERDTAIAGDEAYRLSVTPTGIRIVASGDRGLLYGAMTLAQLLSPDRAFGKAVRVPALTVQDKPRFAWRGLMLDPTRHFLPIESVRQIVDQMASVKLNTLHFHLTDDQGWRFETKRYPKLTEVGAWRTGAYSGGEAPKDRVGGFYTQEELKALVAYAAERGITIVPEIDLPGHAQALVSAYPELGVMGTQPAVSNQWGVNWWLLNPGPKGVEFVKNVLDELMEVFPGTYIHLGGDEAVKDQWQRSPEVQAQIKGLDLKDENQLQSWLIGQFGEYLASKGRRLIGWDEILEGGIPASATIMSWRGEKGAVEAANLDHDVVLSPAPTLYLDNMEVLRGDEPPGRYSEQSLATVYNYEPMPAGIPADKAGHVLGAQGNAWSEYLVTPYQVQHKLFPRAAAIAEMTWSAKDRRDFASFTGRLQPQMERWRRSGLEVSDGSFAVSYEVQGAPGQALRDNRVGVALSTKLPYGTIRYTLNGSEPTARSKAYRAPLSVKPGTTIRAAAFDGAGHAVAAPRTFDTSRGALLTRGNADLTACPGGKLALRVPLTIDATGNGPAYNIDLFNTCSVYPAAPMDIAKGFTVEVARLPRNWALAHETFNRKEYYTVTDHGELVVSAGCMAPGKSDAPKPPVIATFALPDPASSPNRFRFTASLPKMTGDQDLCFQFTSPLSDPFYAVERVTLTEAAKSRWRQAKRPNPHHARSASKD